MNRRLTVGGAIIMMICIAGAGAAEESSPGLARVQSLIVRDRIDDARTAVQEYRRENPSDPRGLMLMARLAETVPTAVALYRDAERMALGPEADRGDSILAAESMIERADLLRFTGDTARATSNCERVILHFPDTPSYPDALFLLGTINLMDGDGERAREKFLTYVSQFPQGDRRLFAAAGIMESRVVAKEWTAALEAARAVLEEGDPDSAITPRVLEVMAMSWRELGNDGNAERFTTRLLDTYPDSWQAHAIREQGNREAAEVRYSFGDAVRQTDVPTISGDGGVAGSSDNGAGTVGDVYDAGAAPKTDEEPEKPYFTIQTGSFKDRDRAFMLYTTLDRAGLEPRVEMTSIQGDQYFRVYVGTWKDRDGATAAVPRIARTAGGQPFVVMVE
jgi:tetratricopeptide (TPR) repeat protein